MRAGSETSNYVDMLNKNQCGSVSAKKIADEIKDILIRENLTIAAAQRLLETIKIELLDTKISR